MIITCAAGCRASKLSWYFQATIAICQKRWWWSLDLSWSSPTGSNEKRNISNISSSVNFNQKNIKKKKSRGDAKQQTWEMKKILICDNILLWTLTWLPAHYKIFQDFSFFLSFIIAWHLCALFMLCLGKLFSFSCRGAKNCRKLFDFKKTT